MPKLIRTALAFFALTLLPLACAPAPADPEPQNQGERGEAATATKRRLCFVAAPDGLLMSGGLVTSETQAEAVWTDYVTGLDRPDLVPGLVPFRPGWDGISEPVPPVYLWFQCGQASLADAQIWADAADMGALYGMRRFEGLVTPDEASDPANTFDSIYAGHTLLADGYNPSLPVYNFQAAMAAYVEGGVLTGLFFPAKSFWGF